MYRALHRAWDSTVTSLTPVDQITLAYIWITGVYAVVGWERLDYAGAHLAFRVVLSLLILLIALYRNNNMSRAGRFVTDIYPLLLLGLFYNETDLLNNVFIPNLDPWLVSIENSIFGMQPSIVFSEVFSRSWFNELMFFGYFSYFVLIAGFLLTEYRKNKEHFRHDVFIITGSFYIYYLIFCLVPAAGPQFHFAAPESEVPATYLFSHLVKFIQAIGERPTGAFPSSHVAMAMIILTLLYRRNRLAFLPAVVLVVLLIPSTIYIKAHYAVDVLGGLLSFPAVYLTNIRLFRHLDQ
ncbi:MAG TPA: phosphatase PAP2 family protein [Bacteroidetes bacterium]|nr:phosphatase PAP2 family protein [Bacteroidota bacterium]